MSTKARTPKGRIVDITTTTYGTSNHGGSVFYGGIHLSSWEGYGSGLHSLEEALLKADERIDSTGLMVEE